MNLNTNKSNPQHNLIPSFWLNSVSTIKGIGEQRLKKLNLLNIYTLYDLLTYYPRNYKDRSQLTKISDFITPENRKENDFDENSEITFIGYAKNIGQVINRGKFKITSVTVYDDTGEINLIWYNQPYMKNALLPREQYLITGKFKDSKLKKKEFSVIELEKITTETETKSETISDFSGFAGGRIIPIYPSTKGLTQKVLRKLIEDLISIMLENVNDNSITPKYKLQDELPSYIITQLSLMDKITALKEIHFPTTEKNFHRARKRLVFEEFFLLQTALFTLKENFIENNKGTILEHLEELDFIEKQLPFTLTNGQSNAILDIKNDLVSGKQMHRLVQGDVGSGKTAVAILISYLVIKNNYQAVIMCPTEVLATQHYKTFNDMFEKLNIETVLLTGGAKTKAKKNILENIKNGKAQMIIGTHSLIQEDVEFKNLQLVITDEQHRFGVIQRGTLSQKGNNPHILVMTATPIPRTLALMVYGDLDITMIKDLPPNRQSITTNFVTPSYHKRIYKFIEDKIKLGLQAYIVCPMVEENPKLELKSVIEYTEELQEVFKDYKVSFIHGKIKQKEKNEIMNEFAQNNINILIATTVIEVGINVPNAVVMVIENAERFGLSQLHQLRGRVGRGSEESFCILVSESKSPHSKKRLKALTSTQDGFKLSEVDLELRGPGEFFGTMQHGIPEFKLGNIYKDMEILLIAQNMAQEFISNKKLNDNEAFLWNERIKNYLENKILDI